MNMIQHPYNPKRNFFAHPAATHQSSPPPVLNGLWVLVCVHFLVVVVMLVFILVTSPVTAQPLSDKPDRDNKPVNSIAIEVTTYLGDKQTFKQGDSLAFLVSLDKEAHLLMIYQDAQNNLIQIIPNRYRPQKRYPAGLFIAVPGENEPFEFSVKPPYGKEKLWTFASQRAFPILEGDELGNGLKKLKGNMKTILQHIRPANRQILYGEASTTIMTTAR